jgi:spore cortex formation protein SpoVR/YcgB (stage V sporulation)
MLKDEKFIARYGMNKSVEKIAKELSNIRKQINQVSNLPKDIMKREEKDKLIKELRAAESEILKTINVKELRKEAKI